MAEPFAGQMAANIRSIRLRDLRVAQAGHLFEAGVGINSGNFGLREDAFLDIKPGGVDDTAGRLLPSRYEASLEMTVHQTSLDYVRNALVLARAPHQLRAVNAAGEYIHFVNNSGAPGPATGSTLIGLDAILDIGQKERKLALKWFTEISPTELRWMLANAAAAHLGGTGGSGTGMSLIEYDRDHFEPSNFHMVKVANVDVGHIVDVKIHLETDGRKDSKERRLANQVKITAEATMLQTKFTTDLMAAVDAGELDSTVNMITSANEDFEFNGGAVSITPEIRLGDKDNYCKLLMKGIVPFNQDEEAPDTIDLGITTPGKALFNLVGYA